MYMEGKDDYISISTLCLIKHQLMSKFLQQEKEEHIAGKLC